jgi:hypothetical protein
MSNGRANCLVQLAHSSEESVLVVAASLPKNCLGSLCRCWNCAWREHMYGRTTIVPKRTSTTCLVCDVLVRSREACVRTTILRDMALRPV